IATKGVGLLGVAQSFAGCSTLRGFFEGWVALYRLACPRAIFFTLRFCDPRAYSRGLSGFSAFRFLRDARFVFLRSSLLRVLVLAMNALAFLSIVFSATNAN